MAKVVCFLLHGIGIHNDDWATKADGPIEEIKKAAKNYAALNAWDMDKAVIWEPIRYDDIFDAILEHWKEQGANLLSAAKAADITVPDDLEKILDGLVDAAKPDQMAMRYVGDVVLYKFFPLFRRRVLLRVIATMAEKVVQHFKPESGEDCYFVVIGHSMGTSVAHDAMHALGTTDWVKDHGLKEFEHVDPPSAQQDFLKLEGAQRSGFAPGQHHFSQVFMLANVSYILRDPEAHPYHSIVAPIALSGRNNTYCGQYWNFRHQFDPIPNVMPFEMPALWLKSNVGFDVEVKHFYGDYNIHGFAHYLRHPKVHVPVLASLYRNPFRSQAELARDASFPASDVPGKLAEAQKEWAKKLADAKAKGNVSALIAAWQSMPKL